MQHARTARRSVLLALTLLSACAASEPSSDNANARVSNGVIGDYLAGRFALSEGDAQTAANDLLKAVAQTPGDPELTLQAFIATLNAGRPEAVKLARQLPDSQVAQLVLADVDIKAGRWQAAEQRFHALPRQGLTQLLQPLLVAWAQQGDGRTDTALSTLRPYVDNPRFRTIFALHAAMIADLGDRKDDAAKLYRSTETDSAQPNVRMAQILASWEARSSQPGEAQRTLASLPAVAPDLAITMPALMASVTRRPVARAADGVAEAYFTFAALLQAQDANDFALIMLRLALDLRPDFATARLLAADILQNQHRPELALRTLNEVPATDPLIAIVQLRRAALVDRLGRSDDSMRDLERLARDYPDSPLPDEQRGDILRSKERFPDAVVAYDRAIARVTHPAASDWVLFYDRGVAEERAHQWQKAEADFHRALELSPDQPFVLNYLGYSWADMGHHLNEARQMIQRAAERRPNDGAITDSLGWVLFRQGDAKGAVTALEHAVEIEPEDSTINGHLGDAYWAAGRKIEAQYQWRRALTLSPTADDAAKLEAKLNTGRAGAVLSGQ
ncbi:MAG: Tetratricopeptide repeat family protein [Rhodopila sp.]|nr:Tetratricopeptide repeat family protein [Rhodopila sp.]